MPSPNRRPGFSRRAQYGLFFGYVVALAGVVVALGLLALSAFDPIAYRALRGGVAEITTPVSSGMAWVARGIVSVPGGVGAYFGVVDENIRLKRELVAERALVLRARTLHYENRRLRMLLRLRDGTTEPVVTARLVNSSASSTRRFATLNAGAWQGVRSGQPVQGPDGLVGRIVSVSPNTARVLLLSDPESIVPVRRTRDGMAAIAVGRGDGWLEVKSAAGTAAPFARGDVFMTSGNGGLFPPGIPVARILNRSSDTALGQPFAQPDTFDFALVLRVFVEQPPVVEPSP